MEMRWLYLPGLCFVFCAISVSAVPPLIQMDEYPQHDVLSVMRKVCDWQIEHNYDASATWHYGALLPGITAASEATKQGEYMDAAIAWAEKFNWELLDRVFHADDHTCE